MKGEDHGRDGAPGAQDRLASFRFTLVNRILWATAVLGGIAAWTAVFQEISQGRLGAVFTYVAAHAAIVVLALRKSVRYEIRAAALPLILFLVGLSELCFFTIVSNALLYFFGFVIFMGVLYGLRAGLAAMLLSLVAVAAAGYLHLAGILPMQPFPLDLALSRPELARDPLNWITMTLPFLFLAGAACSSLALLVGGLNESMQSAEKLVIDLRREMAERQRAEEQRGIFMKLSEHSSLGFGWSDLEGRILHANTALLRMHGAEDFDGMRGKNIRECYPDAERPRLEYEILPHVFRTGQWVGELRLISAHGKETSTIQNIFLITDDDGAPVYLANVLTDITERREAEEALRKSEERYRLVADNASDAIWTRDLDLELTYMSPAVERLTGYTVEEAMAMPNSQRLTPASMELMTNVFAEERERERYGLTDPARTRTLEIEIMHKDGSMISTETVCRFLRDEYGNAVGVLGINRDITERKRAEKERLSLERQVQRAQKLESLGVLAGGIAHDFNNILVAVLGYAELSVEALDETHPALASVRKIEKGARRAADLTRQMLAYSGRGQFVVEALAVSTLIDDMVHLLRTSVSRKIELNLAPGRNLALIEADVAQIQQVVMNLITNASESIGDETGTITLSTGEMACEADYFAQNLAAPTSPEYAPPAGNYVYFEVSDTGCGMDEETKTKLFDPFFTTKFTGRGLGMAAVLGIVRGHSGAILLDTAPGKGSTFRVFFPAREKPSRGERKEEALRTEEPPKHGVVLVVDDEAVVCELAAEVLESHGLTVLSAPDGVEGVRVFREHVDEIGCVLLDLTMPLLDGEGCLRELRQIKDDIPVVLSSGYDEQEISSRFVGQDLAGFIQKPYQLEDLVAKIREALRV